MFDLTGFQRDLLYVLAKLNRPSGQTVMDRISEERDEDVNHGRLYPNLDVLVERGFVQKGQHDRRTNFYELTDEGMTVIEERRQWENQYLGERKRMTSSIE